MSNYKPVIRGGRIDPSIKSTRRSNLANLVIVAFKAEVDSSEIERVLKDYPYTKVLKGEFDDSRGIEDKLLDRLYSLAVGADNAAAVITGLTESYGSLIETAYQPTAKRTL